MVDNQNSNARYLDKFGKGTTSVKLHAPPGGHSTFSLGWGNDTTETVEPKKTKKIVNTQNKTSYQNDDDDDDYSNDYSKNKSTNNNKSTETGGIHQGTNKSSTRVKHAPGGESTFKFG